MVFGTRKFLRRSRATIARNSSKRAARARKKHLAQTTHPSTTLGAGIMAASSGDDVPTQLATLLGKGVVQIRKTDDTPPWVSVIDVAVLITGKDANKAAQDVATVKDRFPDVTQNLGHVKFPDSRGRKGQKVVVPGPSRPCYQQRLQTQGLG